MWVYFWKVYFRNITYSFLLQDELERPKPRIEIPALGTGKREGKVSKEETIRAIEAKLKSLERRSEDDLELNAIRGEGSSGASQIPFIQRYQFNKDRDSCNSSMNTANQRHGHSSSNRSFTKPAGGPYNRNQRPKRR